MKKTLKTFLVSIIAVLIIGGVGFAVGATWSGSEDVEVIESYLDAIDNLLDNKNKTIKDLEKQLYDEKNKDDELKQAEKDVKEIRHRLEQIINKYNK
ncbi:MAG TPA: hypothetical protein VIK77_06935 [Tissierellaceae bacterium]